MDYLTVKSAYQSQAIPGKNKFTFVSKLTGIPQVWTLDGQQQPVLYIEADDRIVTIYHSPQGDKTVIGVDCKGNEKQQLFLVSEDHPQLQALVHSPDHFHYVGGWSPDGRYLSYASNRRHPGYFDVFVIDTVTNETETIFSYDGNCIPLCWANQDNVLISIRETNLDSAIYSIDVKSKEKTRIGRPDALARYQSIIMKKNGEEGYYVTDLDEETAYLSRFSLATPEKTEKLLHWEKWDIEELSLSPTEEVLIFTLNEGGISKLGIYYPLVKQHEMITDIPEGIIDSLSWLNEDELIFTLKTPTMPGDIWKYSLSGKKVTRLTYIGQSQTVGENWRKAQLYSYTSFDGLEVPYFYYEQESNNDKPAVIYVHGGPESQLKAEYHPVLQYLVHQGFAVAAPNVRGSSGYGRTYIQLDDARKRMDSVKDLAWLVKDLIKTHGVNPQKIGIMGRSYGGFMVLAALTHYPDLWAAGVDIVGISNLKNFLMNTGEWRRYLRECEYGFLDKDGDFLDKIAPANHAAKIKAPLFVFHGRNDTRVPVSESEQLVHDMKERGQQVEFIVFEDEGHQTEKLENHITMHQKTVEFFSKHLM
ncbi:S9 family peptidase [Bacillaceae bacterium Marseille-Q3522]|nr:S9 family peptidase [Bacillaceae bacterium Marseille-Q3522]